MGKRKINELKAGAILSYINLAIGCVIPLIYTPIMLRILGQEEYGLYSLSNSVIGYLTLLNFGMGSAVVRYITKYKAEDNKKQVEKTIGLFLLMYCILASLVILCGYVISANTDIFFEKGLTSAEISKIKVLICIMSISTAISFPVSVYSSVAIAYEKYFFRRIIDIIATILVPILNLVFLYAGSGSIGMALVGMGVQLLYCPVFIGYCRYVLKIKADFRNLPMYLLKEIAVFSAFIFMSSVVDMLYWATDKVLIGSLIGSAAVAVYNVGGVFTSMLQQMAHAISNVFTPRVTTMVIKDADPKQLSELLIRIGRLQYLIVSFILCGYIVFGQLFIHFWAGDSYGNAYFVALMTMIPLSVPLIESIAFSVIVAQNKHQFRSVIYAIIAVINVISTYIVIPRYGIIGASVCTCIAFTLGQGIIMNIYYWKVTKLDICNFWKNIIRMSVVPVICIGIGYVLVNRILPVVNIFFFLLEVVIFSIVYLSLTWFVTMNTYEKNLFLNLLVRRKNESVNL